MLQRCVFRAQNAFIAEDPPQNTVRELTVLPQTSRKGKEKRARGGKVMVMSREQ